MKQPTENAMNVRDWILGSKTLTAVMLRHLAENDNQRLAAAAFHEELIEKSLNTPDGLSATISGILLAMNGYPARRKKG